MHPTFGIRNKYMENVEEDFLYHFGFGMKTLDIRKIFGDTKKKSIIFTFFQYVCTGGSPTRLKLYAELFSKEFKLECSENLSKSDRFVMYKTGKVLWINHGMGTPSLSIMLVETLKLMHHAKAKDVTFFRLGTSGGVGIEPGTVVITTNAMNAELNNKYVQWIAGKKVEHETFLDEGVRSELVKIANEKKIPIEIGLTMCADDFYEGQMRLDGFFCDYKSDDKMAFLKELHEKGVRNIEMESTCFASMTHRAGVKAAIVCVALLNRMKGDQIKIEHDQYVEFEQRPFRLVTAFIKKQLEL
ncbi:uridine phosphorylase [Dictyocaulus viviparus]|uniref:Uridine phosphorylase n=1 Tax=Dictyocaulus viviparus TaxID=29172 RepID=A0A0D8XS40_DICVI|nr:uridine phosphorylase [Dictyocaulus viviparus]